MIHAPRPVTVSQTPVSSHRQEADTGKESSDMRAKVLASEPCFAAHQLYDNAEERLAPSRYSGWLTGVEKAPTARGRGLREANLSVGSY